MPGVILILVLLAAPLGFEPAQIVRGGESELRSLAVSGTLADLRWQEFSDYKARVQAFYEPTGYVPAWIESGRPSAPARAIAAILEDAAAKGLDPEDYDGSRWPNRFAALSRGNASQTDLARFDLALTISVMRYISDLHAGRANPGLYHTHFDLDGDDPDLARFIRQRLVHATNVQEVLDGVEPPYPGYHHTEQALQRYIALAREPQPEALPPTKKALDPGGSYAAISNLAEILRRLGDLPAGAAIPPGSTMYAEPLVTAVKHFQARHGLEIDGRLGKSTLAELNTPVNQRVRQLELTLERWRWMPHGFSRPPIVVNIPEFQLRAFNRAGKSELEMKVVTGGAFHHQTPVFAAELEYIVFRPYWEVPRSIQHAELVPKVERDPSYLLKNGFEVVTPQGVVVSPGAVDDKILAQLRAATLGIRQVPGPKNSLGLVKFVFPNDYSVYMHATPATELFAQSRRDFSHGCIRLEKPVDLAVWVMREKPEWTRQRILEAMNGEKTIQVKLDRPIPVLIVYATAVVLESGEVRFFDDIYGLDRQLEQALAHGYPHKP